jgi:hypothetical protein
LNEPPSNERLNFTGRSFLNLKVEKLFAFILSYT